MELQVLETEGAFSLTFDGKSQFLLKTIFWSYKHGTASIGN